MVSLMVILFSTKCSLFVYMYIDLLKLKAYKLFENSDSDLSLLFVLSQLVFYKIMSDYKEKLIGMEPKQALCGKALN